MIVVIDAAISHDPGRARELHGVLTDLDRLQGKHTWMVPDPERWSDGGAWRGVPWLEEQFQKSATTAINAPAGSTWSALEDGQELDLPGWAAPFARVKPPVMWARWLAEPLYIVVEDAERDASFLRCVAGTLRRERILAADAPQRQWIEFRHGGGNVLAETQRLCGVPYRRRIVVLADSDRGCASAQHKQQKLAEWCQGTIHAPKPPEKQILLHILKRRAIENYLAGPMLRWYVENKDRDFNRDATLQARLDALLIVWEGEFSEEQRKYFHLKKALNPKTVPMELAMEEALLGGLLRDPAKRDHLVGGFGAMVQRCWSRFKDGVNLAWFDGMVGVQEEFLELCEQIESLL